MLPGPSSSLHEYVEKVPEQVLFEEVYISATISLLPPVQVNSIFTDIWPAEGVNVYHTSSSYPWLLLPHSGIGSVPEGVAFNVVPATGERQALDIVRGIAPEQSSLAGGGP